MFIEVIGRQPLPEDLDRDDVEDLLSTALGADGEVTGAGTGSGRWHLDIDLAVGTTEVPRVVDRLAAALVAQDLGWVLLRREDEDAGRMAQDLH